ncbi:hypothetical protein [Rhizobium lusitanum]|uniref:Uncharacterized protein n=1 Tax=Rhizobium lusitanum TaxID=293958 RepID=A0A1C3WXR3_9HYPH|nr:hypothetical protein [Rhizobium lusitanum]SCB44783.1 hypothetical protein GA0061101_119103 [Rhizobium lusitanum]
MHAKQADQTYLWTLFRPHVEPTMGFGYLTGLAEWLDCQNLPGIAPSDWIIDIGLEEGEIGHWAYVHDLGGPHEWKIVIAPASHSRSAG